MSDLPRVSPGQSPLKSAGRLNMIIDAARANRQQVAEPVTTQIPRSFPHDQNSQIWVRNDSNFILERFSVVGLDDPFWLPNEDVGAMGTFLNDPIFSVRPPEHCRK